MNEINQLKAEHARYRKALETLDANGLPHAERHRIIDCVLNRRPVTLLDLQDALQKAVDRTGDYVALLMNKDGSGNFRLGCLERRGKEFSNLHDALAMLLSDTDLS